MFLMHHMVNITPYSFISDPFTLLETKIKHLPIYQNINVHVQYALIQIIFLQINSCQHSKAFVLFHKEPG